MKSVFLGERGHWRATEGNVSFGLITQRSKVQILPPQPNPLNKLTGIEHHSYRPASTLISTFRFGIPFLVCHLRAGEANGCQQWSHLFMLERDLDAKATAERYSALLVPSALRRPRSRFTGGMTQLD